MGDEIESTEFCHVVDAARLGWDLSAADSGREMMRILAEFAGNKAVFYSLKPSLNVEWKVELVRTIYRLQERKLNVVLRRIERTLIDDPVKARWLREEAHIHSSSIQQLRQSIADEHKQVVEGAEKEVREQPKRPGITGKCLLACSQAVAAGKGVNVFDTR